MQVPFIDLKTHNQSLAADVWPAVEAVVSRSEFTLGPTVERFERSFADYIGSRHCVGLNNGTSALHLALLASDIGPGDEVITTPLTWISTAWAISYVGAQVVFVDVDPSTYNVDPRAVAAAITPRTKAILPVHLYGQAAELEPLVQLAEDHRLLLIEDAAQAHGAVYRGRRTGSWGRAGCFSFYPTKNLSAWGEAGAVVTDDDELVARVRRLRDHAQTSRNEHVEIGFNARIEAIQAAVLDAKLPHLDAWNAARRRHAHRYHELLADVPGIVLPASTDDAAHVWHLFVVLVDRPQRDSFRAVLAERGIDTRVHYPAPVHLQPAYRQLGYSVGDFPVAEDVAARCVSLPMYAELTDEQIDAVAARVIDSKQLTHIR